MSSQSDMVNVWLKELAGLAGLDELSLNPQGVCALRYGDRVDIVMELPEPSSVLHLYCTFGNVPEDSTASFLRRLLEWNMFGLETRGASFAVDRESKQVMLCYSLPLDGTDIVKFQNTIGNFAEVCERFSAELEELRAGPVKVPENASGGNFLRA